MDKFVTLAPQLGAVCRIFESLFHFGGMTKDDVTPLYDFLQMAPALIDFEKEIAVIVASMPGAESNPILGSVARDLESIARASSSSLISSIDPYILWEREIRWLKQDVDEQAPVTKEAEADYKAAKKEYYDYLQEDDCNEVSKVTYSEESTSVKKNMRRKRRNSICADRSIQRQKLWQSG